MLNQILIGNGQDDYNTNELNFSREIRRLLREREIAFDETTEIKVYYNFNDANPYFRFEIEGCRQVSSTDYYPYNFKRNRINNLDDLEGNAKDILIYNWLGSEIPKEKAN